MKKYRSYRGEMGKAVPNLLARDFHEERPIQLWVTGVTAFSLHGSKPSPSPGLDLYNGEVIRYAIGERANYRQVEEVLAKAFADPRMAAGYSSIRIGAGNISMSARPDLLSESL